MENSDILAHVRGLSALGDLRKAAGILLPFLREIFGLVISIESVVINSDNYSLNSVNGILCLFSPYLGERELFFKYHQEDGESSGVSEYYNSKLLEDAGWPVDVPLLSKTLPGEQVLLYKVSHVPRLADVIRDIEGGVAAFDVVLAQARLDATVGSKYLQSLRIVPREEAAEEALHQLFYYRLVDGGLPGGRLSSFYLSGKFSFPGIEEPLSWTEFSSLKWRINGRLYTQTVGELFAEAIRVLNPANLPDPCPVVLGHGDAHNANVWVGADRLVLFDPAFAGAALPALLADIKPTFHNIFAHRDWLYHPEDVSSLYNARAFILGGELVVEHDWAIWSLQREFLQLKEKYVWIPLLGALKSHHFLPSNWEQYIRLSLFCCPTLVMNLAAGAGRHNPLSSLLGFSIAVMCGSESDGEDEVSVFIERIRP